MLAVGCNGGNGLHGAGPRDGWQATGTQDCSSDQTRSDQTRSDPLSYQLRSLPGVKEEVSPRVCPGIFSLFQSWSWDRARVEARQAGEAMAVWGGMGGKQTREWLGAETSRAGQNRTDARRGGREKNRTLLGWIIPHRRTLTIQIVRSAVV